MKRAAPPRVRRGGPRRYHHGDLRHALIETALQLVTEEQDWAFSLRELARRSGVSQHAPYNHFPGKLDLLAAVAATGFARLRVGLLAAAASRQGAQGQLVAVARTYIRLGLGNPALYRLMFGPALSETGAVDRPTVARDAGAAARAVLEEVILRGARARVFAVAPDSAAVALAAIAVWSATHGLTMLAIDRLARADLAVDAMIDEVVGMIVTGLCRGTRGSHARRAPRRSPTSRRRSAAARRAGSTGAGKTPR